MSLCAILISMLFFTNISHIFSSDGCLYSDEDYARYADYLNKKGRKEQALQYYKKAFECNPGNLRVNDNLFSLYFNVRDYVPAEKCLKKLLEAYPNNYNLHFYMGVILLNQGKVHKSIYMFKKSLFLKKDYDRALHQLGQAYFKAGNLKKAREQFKILEKGQAGENKIYRTCDNTNLSDKTVLIKGEGGIGDVFFWMRYAQLLKEKEKGVKVIFQVRNFLVPIVSLCPYIDEVVPKGKTIDNFDFEFYVGYLYKFYKTNMDTIPAPIPYMRAHPQLIKKWAHCLSKDKKFKVGICWDPQYYLHAVTEKPIKNNRAMPLMYFYPLSKIENVSLYSLQRRNGTGQLEYLPKDFSIHVFDEKFDKIYGSFMDTAAVMKNLDLVVTVDTSVAHLAGALGVPVWILLPYISDMRWFMGRSDSPWYRTMRIFKQKKEGDWESVLEEVVDELCRLN